MHHMFILFNCFPGSESENWRKDMRPVSPRGGHSRRGGRGGGMRGRGRGGVRGRGNRIDAESLTGNVCGKLFKRPYKHWPCCTLLN